MDIVFDISVRDFRSAITLSIHNTYTHKIAKWNGIHFYSNSTTTYPCVLNTHHEARAEWMGGKKREVYHSMFIIEGRKMAATDGGYYTRQRYFSFVKCFLLAWASAISTTSTIIKFTETANTNTSLSHSTRWRLVCSVSSEWVRQKSSSTKTKQKQKMKKKHSSVSQLN